MLAVCGVILARADDNIAKAQTRLKMEGFYFGNPTGAVDNSTADALTRYQIRHGLAITGKLDAPTARSLHISLPNSQPAPPPQSTPKVLTGSWQRLESGEMQFVEEQPAPLPPAGASSASAPAPAVRPQPAPPAEGPNASIAENRPPPTLPPPANGARPPGSPSTGNIENPERFRDYIGAFILAGLAPSPDAEIKFFAGSVDYLGVPNVPRQQIQRDLVRYDQKWPHRRFWMDGDIQIEHESGNAIKLVFPLRYELRNGSRYASGKVMKSLTVLTTATNEMQIVAVNEWRAPE
jgi:hypothetical protein